MKNVIESLDVDGLLMMELVAELDGNGGRLFMELER